MLQQMKSMARPYGALFALALSVAVVARIGLAVMDVSGTLAYDYISASGVPILDVICSILTGSAFVAFLFAAALTLSVSTAGVALYGFLCWRGDAGAARPGTAFLWGWATALVSIVCLVVVASGILSAVQVASMSSKLPGMALIVLGVIVFAAFIGTLLGAASMVVCACIKRSRVRGRGLGRTLVVAALGCGLVVMVLTVGTFASINTASIQMGVVGAWFAADIVVNVALMLGAAVIAKKA